jgi:peptide/nickel transport system substrate-binding protein
MPRTASSGATIRAGCVRYPEPKRRQPNGFSTTLLATTTYGMHQSVAEIVQQHLQRGRHQDRAQPAGMGEPDSSWATAGSTTSRSSASGGDSNDPDSLRTLLGMGQAAVLRAPVRLRERRAARAAGARPPRDRPRARAARSIRRAERIGLEDPAFVSLNWRPQAYAMQR